MDFSNTGITNPYRVMLVVQSLRVGGAERMVENLSYALADIGCSVKVVVLQSGETDISRRLANAGIDLEILGKKPGMDLSLIGRLAECMKAFSPDVVHSHLVILHYVVPAAKKAAISNIVHTIHSTARNEVKSSFKAAYCKACYRSGRVLPVALSAAVQQSVVERYGLDSDAVPVVFNGIDLASYRSDRSYGCSDELEIVHVGRFEKMKNHGFLVSSFSDLLNRGVNAHLHLYGTGSLMQEVESLVEGLGIAEKVTFHGLTDDVASALSHADIFVFPSLFEGMPMVLLEAMASGLPILSSPVGGIPDMLEDDCTALLRKTDSSFAEALFDLSKDSRLRERLGRSAAEAVRRFDSHAMGRAYLDVYIRNGRRA